MESLNILHLSDLHVGHFRYETPEPLAIKIADTLSDICQLLKSAIFNKSKIGNYQLFNLFIDYNNFGIMNSPELFS